MHVLLEGRVCTNILSFTSLEYLYTSTVCRAWRQNNKKECLHTDVAVAFESPSRIKEAVENGIRCQCPRTIDESGDDYASNSSCDFFMEYAEIVDADVSVFKAIHDMGYGWGQFTMQNAAIGHKTEIIKFMFEHGCPLNSSVLFNAVNANCLELVQYLAGHNCPIDDTPIETEDQNVRSFEKAISKNYLDIVMCLRSDLKFPFDTNTFKVACNADYPKNLHTLSYLHAQGCRPSSFLFYEMVDDGNFHAVKFMLTHQLNENRGPTAMCIAVTRFQANIMRLLVSYKFEVNSDVIDLATYDMALTRWLIRVAGDSNCKPTWRAYINTVEHHMNDTDCIQTLNWLYNHWKLDTGFQTYDELAENPRWAHALNNRHAIIAQWFKDSLAFTSR